LANGSLKLNKILAGGPQVHGNGSAVSTLRVCSWSLFLALVACVGGESAAIAGGLFVPGAGPVAQGRAGAFVARADDPSTISHNPAGFAKLDGTQLYVGANFLRYVLSYQRAGVYEPIPGDTQPAYVGQPFPKIENNGDAAIGFLGFQALPVFAVSTDLGHPKWPVRFGFGLYSPQAFPTREYSSEVTLADGTVAPAPQRYDVVRQDIVLSSPSLIVAYAPTSYLDIGIRGSWGIGSAKGSKTLWTLRNYEEDPGQDSLFTLSDAKDNFVPTLGLGLLYRPSSSFEIGAAWNSKGELRAQGTGSSAIGTGSPFGSDVQIIPRPDNEIRCDTGGVVGALKACLAADLAQSATLGGRYIFRDQSGKERGDIELDVKWEDWSQAGVSTVHVDGMINVTGVFLEPVVNTHGFEDVISTRLGGSYRVPGAGGEFEFRGGAAYDTRTAPESWSRVDQDNKRRATFATGLAFSKGRYRLDLSLGGVWEPTTNVGICKGPYGPSDQDRDCQATPTAVGDRTQPSPGQPLFPNAAQKESPFNAGTYKSHYLMFATGLRVKF
jgi:long-chain fatty acid transport protein